MTLAPPAPARTGTSRRNLLLAFGSSAAGAVVTYTVNLAIVPFVLHRVGAELYGAWATMASILAVGALADAGIRTEVIRRVGSAQGEGDDEGVIRGVQQGVTLLATLGVAVLVLGVLAAPVIRAFAFPGAVPAYAAGEVDLLIRATMVLLAVSMVANGYFGVLRGVQRADVEATGLLLSVPAAAVVTVGGVSFGWGLWGLFLGNVASLVVSVAWNWRGARRLVPDLRLRFAPITTTAARGYLALSGLALLSQIGDVVDSQWDKLILSRYVGSTAVTSFQIGTSLVLQGKALALLPIAPLLVAIAELRRRDTDRMEVLFGVMARACMVLGAVVLGAVFVFAPVFVRLWLGDDASAAGAANAARLFSVAAVCNLVSAPLAYRAFGEGWHRLAAAGAAANMVVNAVLSLGLTMAIGLNGALYGSIAGNLVGSAFFFVLMRRRMGERWTPPPLAGLAVGMAAAFLAVAAGAARIASWPSFLLAGVVYVTVVGLACTRAEGLKPAELLSRGVAR